MGLMMSSSTSMLYKLVATRDAAAKQGEASAADRPPLAASARHVRVQQISTSAGTVATLVDFVAGPVLGRFMDSYGRVPTMLLALLSSGGARLAIAARPSLATYVCYRVLVAVTGPVWLRAVGAAMGDLYGRGTKEFAVANAALSRYALLASMGGTYAGRMIESPQKAFAVSGALQLSAAAIVAAAARETLAVRVRMSWSLKRISPVSFLMLFRRSRALIALAVCSTLRELPMYMNVSGVYRRQRFPEYGHAQEATSMFLFQVGTFLNTFAGVRIMDGLGLEGATRLSCWCSAASMLTSAYAPRMELLYLGAVFPVFQCGMTAVQRVVQQEAALVGLGQGELGGAEANRAFVPALLMPHVFSQAYARLSDTCPSAPYLLSAALSALTAELVTPWAFGRLSQEVRQGALPISAR